MLLVGLLVRSAVILVGGDILRRFLPRSEPAFRHRLILAAFALLLLWPAFSALIPQIHLSLWHTLPLHDSVTVQQTILALGRTTPSSYVLNAPVLIWFAIWILGVLVAFAPVLLGYVNVLRTARKAAPLECWQWNALLQELCSSCNIAQMPNLLIASGPVMPLTFGLLQPRILLPKDCLEWPTTRRRTVLLHELAHIQRHDIYAQLFVNLIAALWWFQPLCWSSRRSLRRESEQACDATVLASGVRPSEYAAELLGIAHEFSPGKLWSSAAVTVARRGELESRLNAILAHQPCQRARHLALPTICVLTILAVTASAVTVMPEQQLNSSGGSPMKRTILSGLLASASLSAATIGGSLFDPGGVAIPSAKASLYNPDTTVTVESTTTPDGKFTFDNLSAGQYILRVEKPGFASLLHEFNVQSASNVERGFVLKLGLAQEQGNTQVAKGERAAYPQALNPKQLRVGGAIAQSNLVTQIQPVYPPAAKAARTQGPVVLDTTISAEGVPEEITVVSSPSDELTQSALEAVRQWRYKPTLLNGNPVEITTQVLVTYTLSQ